VYADWLEERGDPRGEFIRVQCQLARLQQDNPREAAVWEKQHRKGRKRRAKLGTIYAALKAREQEPPKAHREERTQRLLRVVDVDESCSTDLEFRRGLLEGIKVEDPEVFVARARTIFRHAPLLRSVCLGNWFARHDPWPPKLTNCRYLNRLTGLTVLN